LAHPRQHWNWPAYQQLIGPTSVFVTIAGAEATPDESGL
jgi:hypothetical protein